MNRTARVTAAGITALLLAGCAYATTAGGLYTSPAPAVVSTPVSPAHTAPASTSPGETTTSRPNPSPSVSPTASAEPPAPQPTPEPVVPAPSVEPTPTATPAPVVEAGPTGTRWTTSNLNIRVAPDGSIVRTVPSGTALELTGSVQGDWSEVTGGWVATCYLTDTKPKPKPTATPKPTVAPKPKPKPTVAPKPTATKTPKATVAPKPTPVEAKPSTTPTPTPTKAPESADARCARIWRAAQRYVAAPAGASLTCAPTSSGHGQAGWEGTRHGDGTYTPRTIWAKLSPSYLAKATDAQLTGLAVHELTHLRYHAAGRDAQREAARIMGVTPATWRDGSYYSRATERLAQGGAVCTGATSNWGQYAKTSCSTINSALAVLR